MCISSVLHAVTSALDPIDVSSQERHVTLLPPIRDLSAVFDSHYALLVCALYACVCISGMSAAQEY